MKIYIFVRIFTFFPTNKVYRKERFLPNNAVHTYTWLYMFK
nr:MAG TPA: hypothetical protein [Caudoviricetes sp.]